MIRGSAPGTSSARSASLGSRTAAARSRVPVRAGPARPASGRSSRRPAGWPAPPDRRPAAPASGPAPPRRARRARAAPAAAAARRRRPARRRASGPDSPSPRTRRAGERGRDLGQRDVQRRRQVPTSLCAQPGPRRLRPVARLRLGDHRARRCRARRASARWCRRRRRGRRRARVRQRAVGEAAAAAVAVGEQPGQRRDRDLGRRAGADVQPDRPVHAGDLLRRHAERGQRGDVRPLVPGLPITPTQRAGRASASRSSRAEFLAVVVGDDDVGGPAGQLAVQIGEPPTTPSAVPRGARPASGSTSTVRKPRSPAVAQQARRPPARRRPPRARGRARSAAAVPCASRRRSDRLGSSGRRQEAGDDGGELGAAKTS